MEKLDIGKSPNNLQNIAIKIAEEQIKQLNLESGPKERTVFVLGSKKVGKSTFIDKFFDREEKSHPTLSLEYSFGRRSSQTQGVHKQILNVWELGSLEKSSELIEVPVRSHGLNNFTAVIIIDLSQPNRIWGDVEQAVNCLGETISKQAKDANFESFLKDNSARRIRSDHPDLDTISVFPVPLVIVGGKYDLFQDFDPEIKKQVCRCLRSVAHYLGTALLFYSYKFANLSKILRDTISHFGFGSPSNPFRKIITDYNEPLSIWFGADSWRQIGGVIPESFESIGVNFNAKIPQLKQGSSISPDDPAKDNGFRESLIDEVRAQKDEELFALIRETEVRKKFESIPTVR